MKLNIKLALISISLSVVTYSQTICLGDDITVCVGTPVTIENCGGGILPGFTGVSLTNPTFVNLWDDVWSGAVNIGFNFNFYGNNFNQCVIGSNGLLSFNMANAGGYCPWALGGVGPLPSAGFAAAHNTAMIAYHDMNPGMGGEIMYQTLGTAPNRIFVVLYENIPMFSSGECNYMAIILKETSNEIEYHIANKPMAAGWNGGLAIQGTENNGGTLAHITPGRNNTQWAAFQDARLFTPTSPANTNAYTISAIPYVVVVNASSTLGWENTNGQTYPYNGGVLNIPSVQAGTTGYFLTLAGGACGIGIGAVSDTSFVTGVSSAVGASSTPDICSSGAGTVTANPLAGTPPYIYSWPALGANTQSVSGVSGGNYQVTMTDGMGCTSTAIVNVGDTPANFQGSTTVVSCPGGSDGTAFAEMVPQLGNVTYQWNDPAMQTTQTATGLTAGQYTCTITSDIGCSGDVVVDVTEIPGMIGNIVDQSDVTCNSGNDGMIEVEVIQGTAPYYYSWDNSASTSNIANDLMVGPHTVTITDANGCVIDINGVLGQPAALNITFLTGSTQICPEDDILLEVTGAGGSSPHTFTWYQDGAVIGTGNSITVDPEVTNTNYCVELSEACGSPTDQECTMIYFPTPIVPMAMPDEVEKCVPATFEFFNTSSNGGEIATTFWEFGDNPNHNAMVVGNDSTSHYYSQDGLQTIIMTVTSIYGCVYTDTLVNLIDVKPSPVADFSFSSNPATMFETAIRMQDRSTSDVVYWSWYSPGSIPTTSSSISPVFTFPEGEVGTYPVQLIVETERGCIDTVVYQMNIIEDILFFAPNSFTPDGDEYNQVWQPVIRGIDIYDFDLLIYNRWGELIWESHDPSAGWDGTYKGKIVPTGTYTWVARVKRPQNDGKETFSGSINLLR